MVANGRHKSVALCLMIATVTASGIARAQDPLCNAVLNANAYNIYDSKTASDFQNNTFDQMCHTQWQSVAEYESSAKSLGSGGSYVAISGFLNTNSSDVSNTLKQAYDHLCVRKDQFLRDRMFSQSHVQIADAALSAWSVCVQNSSAGLRSALTVPPDGKTFAIRVHFRGTNPNEKLTLKGYRSDAGYNCKLGDNDIANFTPRDHDITDTDFVLSCLRTSPSHAQVSISTNVTSIGPFEVPSEEFINLTKRVIQLQDMNDTLNITIADLKNRLDNFHVTVGTPSVQRYYNGENPAQNVGSINFWDAVTDNVVRSNCPSQYVLADLEFVMRGKNDMRTPIHVNFTCRKLEP